MLPIRSTAYLVATLVALAICLVPTTRPRGPLPPPADHASASASVFKVVAATHTGTAVYIGHSSHGDALFLTNAHVSPDGTGDYTLVREHESRIQFDDVRQVASWTTSDLALLACPAPTGFAARVAIAGERRPAVGEVLTLLAYPQGSYACETLRVLESQTDRRDYEQIDAILFEGRARPGASGGAVLDAQGRLVALSYAGDSAGSRALGVSAPTIAAFLRSAGLDELLDTAAPATPATAANPRGTLQ